MKQIFSVTEMLNKLTPPEYGIVVDFLPHEHCYQVKLYRGEHWSSAEITMQSLKCAVDKEEYLSMVLEKLISNLDYQANKAPKPVSDKMEYVFSTSKLDFTFKPEIPKISTLDDLYAQPVGGEFVCEKGKSVKPLLEKAPEYAKSVPKMVDQYPIAISSKQYSDFFDKKSDFWTWLSGKDV